MAHVIYPDKHINIMTYPGNDVRVYKNREEEVQILCPKNINVVQESNLTKAIETGTIFDDADDVDNHAEFLVKTKMPTVAMANKGLENPYKLKEVVGSTIGVMDEDGEVEISDTDISNGQNIINDLLDKDSKEFKDVKNVVDDYLDNEDHEYGYDKDFTYDIQQLRDEIQNFKDADISPEDSITGAVHLLYSEITTKTMTMLILIRTKMMLKCLTMMILSMVLRMIQLLRNLFNQYTNSTTITSSRVMMILMLIIKPNRKLVAIISNLYLVEVM